MKIDFKKIITIKNKSQLEEFDINNPIFQNNYLFHYLIQLGNRDGLKLAEFPIHIENNDNLNGFHIAAKEYNYDMLAYLINTYPDYIYNRNSERETFANYIPFEEITKVIRNFPDLNWHDLIADGTAIHNQTLKGILTNLKFSDLLEFIKLYKLKPEQNTQYLFAIINNMHLKTEQKIKLLNSFTDEEINVKNELGEGLILRTIESDDIILTEYLLTRNIDTNYYTFMKTHSPLAKAIMIYILNNKNVYTKKILETLKGDDIFHTINKYMDNILLSLLFARINRNQMSKKPDVNLMVDMEILNRCDSESWNQKNVNNVSPFHMLLFLDYDIYSPILIKNKIKIRKNMEFKSENKKWLELYKTLEPYEEETDNIIIDKYNYSYGTLFQAKFTDVGIFTLYLADTYKDLLIPKAPSYLLDNLTFDDSFPFSDDIISKVPVFPWIINYYSPTSYYIHPYLNNIMNSNRRDAKKRFAIVFLSLISDRMLHANILVYDFKNMTIERFEPYGNTSIIDGTIDNILEEELTWSTGMKYKGPKDYLPISGFQTISDENNLINKKAGDFGGFCLAWCLWWIEMKLKNVNIDSKQLAKKLISRIGNMEGKFSEYIRNYSTQINEERVKYMEKIGINKKISSNINMTSHNDNKLTQHLVDRFSSHDETY